MVAGARWIKSNMNNPKSFELVFAGMTDKGVACYQYRGTNEYNAVITTQRVISDKINSGSDADWNKHCGGKQMTNYTHARQAVF